MRAALLIGVLACAGCFSLRPVQRNHAVRLAEVQQRLEVTPEHLSVLLASSQAACDTLDSRVMGWTATAAAMGVLAGGSGVTSLLTNDTARYAAGGVGVGLSTMAAISTYLSTAYAQKYARQCTVNTGGQ